LGVSNPIPDNALVSEEVRKTILVRLGLDKPVGHIRWKPEKGLGALLTIESAVFVREVHHE
jgi:hypothetical protein